MRWCERETEDCKSLRDGWEQSAKGSEGHSCPGLGQASQGVARFSLLPNSLGGGIVAVWRGALRGAAASWRAGGMTPLLPGDGGGEWRDSPSGRWSGGRSRGALGFAGGVPSYG
jgi:hypothetical protein